MDTQLDWLTGLLNREALRVAGEQLVAGAQASDGLLGIIHIDIDGMKHTNDMLGFPAGDRLIVGIAQAVQTHIPNGAAVGRIGGDEFLMVVPTLNEAAIKALAEAIREEAKTVIVMGGSYDEVPSSPAALTLGLSCYPRHGSDLKSLWIAAEEAGGRGKKAGRDKTLWAETR